MGASRRLPRRARHRRDDDDTLASLGYSVEVRLPEPAADLVAGISL
eukprot:NODE_12440_length_232_cov_15.601093_g10670_i0.p3 GENE.NODE_12440_length_232_cov_15.601093_g10670_i0~~NODE_12440_length_232_cov_15.601093_g10670_i0.p3  ORF type:complete len:54 (-),score=18.92 NODE_12440_length_232_cov_15.601093_g10670_i0:71-208(-)